MLVESVLCIALGISSVADIKRREIPVVFVSFAAILIAVLLGMRGKLGIGRLAGVLAVWGVFTVISIVTEGKLGLGDGMLFALTGLAVGVQKNIAIIMLCIILSFGIAMILFVLHKVSAQSEMPLAPIVFASTLLLMALQI